MFDYHSIQIRWLGHDSFLIQAKNKQIYLDPYELTDKNLPKADFVITSHDHMDHCHPDSINLISTESTILMGPKVTIAKLSEEIKKKKQVVEFNPGDKIEMEGLGFQAIRAYNIHRFRAPGQPFHPKTSGHIGTIIDVEGIKVYHAGDTDKIPEMDNLDVDIALLPVSGTYVMDVPECVEAVKAINPKVVIPMHVGRGIGETSYRMELKEKLPEFRVEILNMK